MKKIIDHSFLIVNECVNNGCVCGFILVRSKRLNFWSYGHPHLNNK